MSQTASPAPPSSEAGAPAEAAASWRRLEFWKRLTPALLLPLFFVVLFPLSYVSAFHRPVPHDVQLTVVGAQTTVAPVVAELEMSGVVTATATDVPGAARSSVEQREADGAIAIEAAASASRAHPSFTVTTYVAGGGGASLSAAVQAIGAKVATGLGTTSRVVDVAPLPSGDPVGSDFFYYFILCSMGGYLIIIALIQVAPGTRLLTRWLITIVGAIATPLLTLGITSIFDGDLGESFGTMAAVLGISSLYVLACAGTAIVVTQFLGKLATFGVMALVVFLNFPSAGGAIPGALLPGFWRWMHSWYFGSGAYESIRSLLYFHGNGVGRWLPQTLAWMAAAIVLTVLIELAKVAIRQSRELATLRGLLAAATPDASASAHAYRPAIAVRVPASSEAPA